VSGDDDRPGYLERDRLSYSERDRLRRERRSSGAPPPRGRAREAGAQRAREADARRATQSYLKEIDRMFVPGQGGAAAEERARAMRDAHGTSALAGACREYRDALGIPADPGLLSLFLDSDDPPLVRDGLAGLRALHEAGSLRVSGGVRSQLRMLLDHPDDEVAEAAEALLEHV